MEKVFEALDRLIAVSDESKYWNRDDYVADVNIVKQALTELQTFKEAKPSEALKCLYKVASKVELVDCDDYWEVRNAYAKVEQYLQKAQEQEKEFDDNFNFKEIGHTMVGFDYKGTQVIAMPLEEYDDFMEQEKENEVLKQIIKSFFCKGSPLHQYIDKDFGLTIEVDDDCSIMHLGEFKGVDLDKKLKEVLE